MGDYFLQHGPMPGELLHSFVVRVLSSYGYIKECKSFLSKEGWVKDPELPSNCSWLFNKNRQPELVNQFAEMVGEKYKGNIFDSPLVPVANFKSIFLNNNYKIPHAYGCIHMSFCDCCFKEQLKEYGFHYFRYDWLLGDICKRHAKPLRKFQPCEATSTYDFVKSPHKQNPQKNYETNDQQLFGGVFIKDFVNHGQETKIAPCAKHKIVRYLLNFSTAFKIDFFQKFNIEIYKFCLEYDGHDVYQSKPLKEYDRVLLRYYKKIQNDIPSLYELITSFDFQEVLYRYKDDKISMYETKVIKDKNTYCSSCKRCSVQAENYNSNSRLQIGEYLAFTS